MMAPLLSGYTLNKDNYLLAKQQLESWWVIPKDGLATGPSVGEMV
jgi:hypothetical protein